MNKNGKKTNKVVVVPANAQIIYAEKKSTLAAAIVLRITAWLVQKLFALMGEKPAREALDALTSLGKGKTAPLAESAALQTPHVPDALSTTGTPAEKAPVYRRESAQPLSAQPLGALPLGGVNGIKTPVKASKKADTKAVKKPAKKVLRPTGADKVTA